MSSVSGLSPAQSAVARSRSVQAARFLLKHPGAVHYTEGSQRWQGIAQHRVAADGEYLTEGDCSATVTWCIWNGIYVPFKVADVVNGEQWHGGFTGTMAVHGREVQHVKNVLPGADAVLYGTRAPFLHTALIINIEKGKPMVMSHGSEGGPYYAPYDYRNDVAMIRRMI